MIVKLLETKSAGGCGKIVGQFNAYWVKTISPESCLKFKYLRNILNMSCLSRDEFMEYANDKTCYGWFINDVERYREPMPYDKRAPQSWCYEDDFTVILSIHKRWSDKILSGEKTMEIRKSYPTKGLK